MSALVSAITYFKSLRNNPEMLLSTSDSMYDFYIMTLDNLSKKDSDRTHWERIFPLAGIYNNVSVDNHGHIIVPDNYTCISKCIPDITSIRKINFGTLTEPVVELWVTSLSNNIARFDIKGNYLGGFGRYSDIISTQTYHDVSDVAINISTSMVAIVMESHHVVHIYDLVTGGIIEVIGIYDSAGDVIDSKLNHPTSVVWLSSGNLVISSKYGKSNATSNNKGHVSEYNPNSGVFVSNILDNTNLNSGQAWHNGVSYPIHLAINNENLYVTYDLQGCDSYVGVFDVSTFEYKTTFGKPAHLHVKDFSISSCYPDIDNNRLYLTTNYPTQLLCLDLTTHDFLGSFGNLSNDASILNSMHTPVSMAVINNTIFIADSKHSKITLVPDDLLYGDQQVEIPYNYVDLAEKRIIVISNADITVNTDGHAYLVSTREILYTYQLHNMPEAYVVLIEEDR